MHSCRALGGGGGEDRCKKYHSEQNLNVCRLDEGTEWVVGCSTETVDSSPSTESMDSWATAPSTESVDFSLS